MKPVSDQLGRLWGHAFWGRVLRLARVVLGSWLRVRLALTDRGTGGVRRGVCPRGCAALAPVAAVMVPGPVRACGLALVLGLDVSASVDAQEYRLQVEGTAAALTAPAVRRAVLAQPTAIAAFVWSGADEQAEVADWVLIRDAAALDRLAGRIAAATRPDWGGRTATGAALRHAAAVLAKAPVCARQVVDIATDDRANEGPDPARLSLPGITVNALAVGGDLPLDHGSRADEGGALTAWLEAAVIRGPGAFVQSADDYRDFARAMERKLLREVMGLPVARNE